MTTLYKSYTDDAAASCIVIGTENKDLYILDPAAFTFLSRVRDTLLEFYIYSSPLSLSLRCSCLLFQCFCQCLGYLMLTLVSVQLVGMESFTLS